eukprot:14398922-Ditylum_brightwellii.AAC.1
MIRFFVIAVAYLSKSAFAAHPAFVQVGFRSQVISPRTVAFGLAEDVQSAQAYYQTMHTELKDLEVHMKELMESCKKGSSVNASMH